MLTSRKPGPPVPPRPSAAAVATALAKHRENSPSQQLGMHTLKPPHPGRTVVYKSPGFDQVKKPQQASVVTNGNGEPAAAGLMKNGGLDRSFQKTEVYIGEPYGHAIPRPVLPAENGAANHRTNSTISNGSENGSKLLYTSTCSIIEINSSSSASTSASSSPMATLHKSESKSNLNGSHNDRNHLISGSAERQEGSIGGQKQLKNSRNHRHLDSAEPVLVVEAAAVVAPTIKRNSPSDVIVINSTSSEHDSGTEQNSMDTNSIASSNSLERENNLKNLENRKAHLTEIIIATGGDDGLTSTTTTVVTNGTATIIEARNDTLLVEPAGLTPSPEPAGGAVTAVKQHVIRTSSVRLPYRPEPEGGEYVVPPLNDNSSISHMSKVIKPLAIDPETIDSKLSEKKVAFHELLISELTAMRATQEVDAASRRQRCPPENRSSTDVSPSGTATRLARIRTSDWIEVGDNGKEVVLSSCQISLEDSGMEDEEKPDDASSGVGDSWDSVKDGEERSDRHFDLHSSHINMSLPGLPPLPKSLSGFDLAGQQLQAHHQHHHHNLLQQQQQQQQQQQHQQHHHQHQSSHQQQQHQHHHHQPPLQPPPTPPQQLPPSLNHHHTNPFMPIGPNLQSVSMASLVSQQRGQSPVGSIVSGSNSIVATPNSGSTGSSIRKPTTLDTQLAILRREMYGLRQLDLSLLSQLWALNESIQEFRTMLQEQETLSPPSPTPSNSDVNSVSSDEDEDDSSTTQTAGGSIMPSHNLIESVAAASVLSSSQSQSSRMRAPPPPPPNRKAPSRPV